MSAYRPYPKYKPSGVEWLGDVPEHWITKAIKWESNVARGASPRPIDDPIYFDDEGEYEMQPPGIVDERRKFLGIRLRQIGFRPFITIWGTRAQMRDFHPCELTDEVKSYLQDCIGHTISR